jgi:hypothetical protein
VAPGFQTAQDFQRALVPSIHVRPSIPLHDGMFF